MIQNLRKVVQPTASKIKWLLLFLAALIIAVIMAYTSLLVDELRERQSKLVNIYGSYLSTVLSKEDVSSEDFDFLVEQIVPGIDFPLITTDNNDEPSLPFEDYALNVEIDTGIYKTQAAKREYLVGMINNIRTVKDPIVLYDSEGDVLQKFYMDDSDTVNRLKLFPLIQLLVVGGFILIGYVGVNYIRVSEQKNVWAGMAKEAAHQLGTPISSLMAWLEIIKLDDVGQEQVGEAVREMQRDLDRLSRIADRFSKIGSKPDRKQSNIAGLIRKVAEYYEYRLPRLGKKVEMLRDLPQSARAEVNPVLFEWVIENLIKNAAESMEDGQGSIAISLQEEDKKTIILVKDSGKGMNASLRRNVFKPGFTTKKRGWGLGLSLCKRIVEEYHNGRIYIKDSVPGKGTTFAIELKRAAERS